MNAGTQNRIDKLSNLLIQSKQILEELQLKLAVETKAWYKEFDKVATALEKTPNDETLQIKYDKIGMIRAIHGIACSRISECDISAFDKLVDKISTLSNRQSDVWLIKQSVIVKPKEIIFMAKDKNYSEITKTFTLELLVTSNEEQFPINVTVTQIEGENTWKFVSNDENNFPWLGSGALFTKFLNDKDRLFTDLYNSEIGSLFKIQ